MAGLKVIGGRAVLVPTLVGLLLCVMAAPVGAQTTVSSIIGTVSDESGSVLPGVTVTTTSPALQVPSITVVTDERGEYRIAPLPLGVYEVVYTLSGFQTFRRTELRLTAGFVATQDVQLKVGSLEESVTVSGAAPVVDVTSTAVTTGFNRETLEITPTGRNGLLSLSAQLPGVRSATDVGGNLTVAAVTLTVNGQAGDSWITMEGVVAMSPKKSLLSGSFYDYASTEEVQAAVVTTDADVPMKGLKLNYIMKSGSNTFHASSFASFTNQSFQGSNLTPALQQVGLTTGDKVVKRYDVSQDLGGRFIPNKLWFYASTRESSNVDVGANAFKPDGSPAELLHRIRFATGKLQWQATQGNKFIAFVHWNSKNDNRSVTQFIPWERRTRQQFWSTIHKGEWQYVRGASLVASVQNGFWDYGGYSGLPNNEEGQVATIRTLDNTTLYQTGSAGDGRFVDEIRYQPKATMSWYKTGAAGNHEVKAGFEFMNFALNTRLDAIDPSSHELRLQNGVPFQVITYNGPIVPKDPVRVTTFYGGDAWTWSRLTLNLAARYSHENAFTAERCRGYGEFAEPTCQDKVQLPIFNSVSPRIHFAYDLTGDAQTVVKGGFTRYYQMRGGDEPKLADTLSPTTSTWTWRDLNGDKRYQPGEVNLNPNGPDFISITGGQNMVVNPDEKQEKTDEWSLSVERQIMPNFGVRLSGEYSTNFDQRRLNNNLRPYSAYNIPITNRDPGPDGVVNNADDPGTFITYYDYPASLRGRNFVLPMFVQDPSGTQRFKTIEMAASKRLADNWQLMASYSATKKDIPWLTNSGSTDFRPLTTNDPNAEIFSSDRTWDWQWKMSGAYQFPYGLMGSANYQVVSGNVWARQVQFRGGVQIPAIVLNVEEIGSQRLETNKVLDLRVEKTFRFAGSQRLQVRLNVFNATNTNTTTTITARAGANFNRITAILPPRIIVTSVGYDF